MAMILTDEMIEEKLIRVVETETTVVCDSTNNSPLDIQNNVLNIDILIKPKEKIVLCYRCLSAYDIFKAPRTKQKRLNIFEPECPECACRLYFS